MMIKSLIGGAAVLASVTLSNASDLDGSQTNQAHSEEAVTWLAVSFAVPDLSLLQCGATPDAFTSCNLSWRHFLN